MTDLTPDDLQDKSEINKMCVFESLLLSESFSEKLPGISSVAKLRQFVTMRRYTCDDMNQ